MGLGRRPGKYWGPKSLPRESLDGTKELGVNNVEQKEAARFI